MKEPVSIETFLERAEHIPVIDVRSPAEFLHGHIPGALNIPLFSDEERKIVGTLYKQKGQKEAIIKGFEFVGLKTEGLKQKAIESSRQNQLLVHCWRGGMRSGAMAWLFERAGLQCDVLSGGYKSFRKYLRSFMSRPARLLILGGMTGTGKTGILREIAALDYQTIDLEKLAHHKGSAFGALGESNQPTNEQFDNDLLMELMIYNRQLPVWIEDESRNIGKNIIPNEFFLQMRQSPVIFLDMDRNLRIDRLVKEYGQYPAEELTNCILRLSRRIGGQNAKRAVKCIEENNYHEVADITLQYYDKTYNYGLNSRTTSILHHIKTNSAGEKENARLIIDYCRYAGLI